MKIVLRPKEESCNQYANAGFEAARPDSEVFFYCNDDIFLCENSLFVCASLSLNKNCIVNALCNSDNGFSYYADFNFNGWNIPQFFRIETIEPFLEQFFRWGNFIEKQPFLMFPLKYLAMYATAIPASIWRKLEGFDIKELGPFGAADVDFCLRARKLGVHPCVTTNAFILHFGGVTSSKTQDDARRLNDRELFKKKWGFLPEQI